MADEEPMMSVKVEVSNQLASSLSSTASRRSALLLRHVIEDEDTLRHKVRARLQGACTLVCLT
jgi:hypothetical protein